MYGHSLTPVQRAILLRSEPWVHVEDQFDASYDCVSFSATMAEGEDCARFKEIAYSNPAFWDEVYIATTRAQEELMYAEAKAIEGMPYDTFGVAGLATDLDIIKPDPDKTWCSKTCARIICAGKPLFGVELIGLGYTNQYNIDPTDLMMIAKYWFEGR